MRRSALAVACLLLVAGCGGNGLVSGSDLGKQQDAADEVARLVVSTLVDDIGASAPSGNSLGRGLYAGCDGGDPDQASYFIDTFVTYPTKSPARASAEVAKALRAAGLTVTTNTSTGDLSTSKGDVTVDLSTQDKGGGSAGQNIFVSTGCLAIGKQQISTFNAKNGRGVTP